MQINALKNAVKWRTFSLLKLALNNVDGCDGYDGTNANGDVCWGLVAQLFFASEKVDTAAQRNLDKYDYCNFKDDAVMELTDKLEVLFGDALTERHWKIFALSQTLNSMTFKPFNWFEFALGISSAFLYKKIFDWRRTVKTCNKLQIMFNGILFNIIWQTFWYTILV